MDRVKSYDRKYKDHGATVRRTLATNAANARWKKHYRAVARPMPKPGATTSLPTA